jgi:hypothetical protein
VFGLLPGRLMTSDPDVNDRKFSFRAGPTGATGPARVGLSSERLGKSHSPIDVANLMEKIIYLESITCV